MPKDDTTRTDAGRTDRPYNPTQEGRTVTSEKCERCERLIDALIKAHDAIWEMWGEMPTDVAGFPDKTRATEKSIEALLDAERPGWGAE